MNISNRFESIEKRLATRNTCPHKYEVVHWHEGQPEIHPTVICNIDGCGLQRNVIIVEHVTGLFAGREGRDEEDRFNDD